MFTISKIVLLSLLVSCEVWAQSTPTPTAVRGRRFADCVVLADGSASEIGDKKRRVDISFWAETGPMWCAHPTGTPSPNKTPGNGWAKMNTGQGLSICNFHDQPLWCFGSGGVVCYDESRLFNQ